MGYLESQIRNRYEKTDKSSREGSKIADFESRERMGKQRQAELYRGQEEKAMLEAVAKGYNVPGYNTDAVKTRLEQLSKGNRSFPKLLAENDASTVT